MRKFCSNKSFMFSLITAFLFLQLSNTHIHLAGKHEHSDGQHQHAVTAHQHQLASYHEDVIDVAAETLSHADSNKVVELEHVCTKAQGKLGEQYAAITSSILRPVETIDSSGIVVLSSQLISYQSYHQYTSIRLRAPPVVS
ncbi:MAG: hypothetical protein OEW89_04900 [Gammaproteobacteria bacterium]|nr:hypothetical protein [Gammaproteobacteria bacterium]MDH5593531.1 hypothetical protein [Gammaproteobacteria bacterium]MDH5614416.1 hypothetical protein [Gammaproteobacteria bacterium]